MSRNTFTGEPLTPGVNVDPVDILAGKAFAAQFGYTDWEAQMVVEYALRRHARGEEDGALATWRSYYPNDLTTFYMILAHAVATGTAALEASK